MENVGIFYGHKEYFMAVCYILWPFGSLVVFWYIFPCLVFCVKKNLATLILSSMLLLRKLKCTVIVCF
jgi:hypothetical protein